MRKYTLALLALFVSFSAVASNPDSLKQLLSTVDTDPQRVEILIDLVNLYQNLNIEEAFPFAKEAVKLSRKTGSESQLGDSYIALGRTFANSGNGDSAMVYFRHALTAFEKTDDSLGMAKAFSKFIFIETYQNSNYDLALEHAFKALKIYEGLNSEKGIIGTYNDIGTIFQHQGKPKESNEWAKKALAIADEKKISSEISVALTTIAYNLLDEEKFEESFPYFERLVQMAEDSADPVDLAIALNGKANALKLNGNYREAMKVYNHSLKTAEKANFKPLFPSLLSNRGQVHFYLKNHKKALKDLLAGLDLSLELGQTNNLQENYEFISNIYQKIGNHSKALEFYKKHVEIKDSLFNSEKEQIISELNTKYKTEQKEKEIALLAKDNAQQESEIKTQTAQTRMAVFGGLCLLLLVGFLYYRFRYVNRIKEELDASNTAKNRLFAIISHDLRGAVSGFQNVGSIINFHIKKQNFDRLKGVGEQVSKSANNLNNLLDNLLQWSLTQMEGVELNPENVSLKKEADEIVELFRENASAKEIKLISKVPGDLRAFADANSIQLVLRNLVSNALKFSSEGDRIEIKGFKKNGFATLEVADTGAGIPTEKLDSIFQIDKKTSSKGTAGEQGTGLGLALCKEFAERNGGSVRLESEEGKGTNCYVELPVGVDV